MDPRTKSEDDMGDGQTPPGEPRPRTTKAVEPPGERRRIVRHLAVEDLGLVEQQLGEVGHVASRAPSLASRHAFTSAWRMLSSRIGLAPAPRFWRASRRSSSRSRPGAAGDQAGGAVGQALRGAHVGDALAQRRLHGRR